MTVAQADQWFDNPLTGQRTRVITFPHDNGGRRFVFEYVFQPRSGRNALPRHVHPTSTETFEVLAGRAAYEVGGNPGTATAGEKIVMPANVAHSHPWSDSDDPLHVRHINDANPADERSMTAAVQAVVTILGLANAGRVNSRGAPGRLQLIVLANATIPGTYLADIPRPIQRAAFGILAVIGRTTGLRTAYPAYGVVTADGINFG